MHMNDEPRLCADCVNFCELTNVNGICWQEFDRANEDGKFKDYNGQIQPELVIRWVEQNIFGCYEEKCPYFEGLQK